ncbi:DUF742 domain-containing protein [Streptomyces sp. NPDC058256]|uniref:DUF742 domain-containing protein n=1 Tax=Streptomyces sp. NPDC058256 TaxID=3346408 RepID=UPI0036ECEBBF
MTGLPPRPVRTTRAYALTGTGIGIGTGAARAAGHEVLQLAMHSLVQAAVSPSAAYGYPREWQAVLAWSSHRPGVAVAEIAARLGLQLTPTRLLLDELHIRGLVACQAAGDTDDANIALLLRIRTCLEVL